jgi:hypothetical protein
VVVEADLQMCYPVWKKDDIQEARKIDEANSDSEGY